MKKVLVASLLLTVCTAFTSCGADSYNDGYNSESFVSTTDVSDYDHDKRITEDDASRKENRSSMSITDNGNPSVSDHIRDATDGVGDAGKDLIDGAQNAGDELIDGAQDAGDNIIDGMDGEPDTLGTDDTFTE